MQKNVVHFSGTTEGGGGGVNKNGHFGVFTLPYFREGAEKVQYIFGCKPPLKCSTYAPIYLKLD